MPADTSVTEHSPNAASAEIRDQDQQWTRIIRPERGLLAVPVKEMWGYRDLALLLVRRDFVAMYKQSILGPLWFIIQPVLTTIVFTIVFGNIAKISTDGLPQTVFYMSGITCWTYFSDSLTKISETFVSNASIFGKVYFPRVIIPFSIIVSNLMRFAIQFGTFIAFSVWYWLNGASISPNLTALLLPFLLLLMAMLGLGIGMIISALTTKYRDLRFLLSFAVQLLMYATPVIYPASSLPEKYAIFIKANPITPIIEAFRYGFLGRGAFDPAGLAYSFIFASITLLVALVVFNQIEKNFMDTV